MRMCKRTCSVGLIIGLAGLLLGCTLGSEDKDPSSTRVRLDFPTATALVEQGSLASLQVRGTATDNDSGIAGLTVNGVAAASEDGFAHWSAEVPLHKAGDYPLDIRVSDKAGNRSYLPEQAQLHSVLPATLPFIAPSMLALDLANQEALVTDLERGALLAVDLNTGKRRLITDGGGAFHQPRGVALDGNGHAWLTDVSSAGSSLIRVDLRTGEHSVLADTSGAADSIDFKTLVGLALDDADHAWVVDYVANALIKVRLSDGRRTLVSGGPNNSVGSGVRMLRPFGLALDSHGYAWVTTNHALIKVDLKDGSRTLVSGAVDGEQRGFGPDIVTPLGIVVDGAGQTAWVTDSDNDLSALIRINLLNGGRERVASNTDGWGLQYPIGIALDHQEQQAWVVSGFLPALLNVNLQHGTGRIVSGAEPKVGSGPALSAPQEVVWRDKQLWLVDSTLQALLKVDSGSGARTLVSRGGEGYPGVGDGFHNPHSLALGDQHQAWVIDYRGPVEASAVVRVDLDTGHRVVVSRGGGAAVGRGPSFKYPLDMAVDSKGAWVIDNGLKALMRVDLGLGHRTLISGGDANLGGGPLFERPRSVTLDHQGNAWVIDVGSRDVPASLLKVNLDNGARQLVSGGSANRGAGPAFVNPSDVALDDQGYAWVPDQGTNKLLKVDLASGNRVSVSQNQTDNSGAPFSYPEGLALDLERQLAWVVDGFELNAKLMAVDMVSGQRVIVSK